MPAEEKLVNNTDENEKLIERANDYVYLTVIVVNVCDYIVQVPEVKKS